MKSANESPVLGMTELFWSSTQHGNMSRGKGPKHIWVSEEKTRCGLNKQGTRPAKVRITDYTPGRACGRCLMLRAYD